MVRLRNVLRDSVRGHEMSVEKLQLPIARSRCCASRVDAGLACPLAHLCHFALAAAALVVNVTASLFAGSGYLHDSLDLLPDARVLLHLEFFAIGTSCPSDLVRWQRQSRGTEIPWQ